MPLLQNVILASYPNTEAAKVGLHALENFEQTPSELISEALVLDGTDGTTTISDRLDADPAGHEGLVKGAIAGGALGALLGPIGVAAGGAIGAGIGAIAGKHADSKDDAIIETAAGHLKDGSVLLAVLVNEEDPAVLDRALASSNPQSVTRHPVSE